MHKDLRAIPAPPHNVSVVGTSNVGTGIVFKGGGHHNLRRYHKPRVILKSGSDSRLQARGSLQTNYNKVHVGVQDGAVYHIFHAFETTVSVDTGWQ